jgi:hypothetical protein
MMTTEEYQSKLKAHDWFYDYSDDHSVWRRGKAERQELWHHANESDEFMQMFCEYRDKMFQR